MNTLPDSLKGAALFSGLFNILANKDGLSEAVVQSRAVQEFSAITKSEFGNSHAITMTTAMLFFKEAVVSGANLMTKENVNVNAVLKQLKEISELSQMCSGKHGYSRPRGV